MQDREINGFLIDEFNQHGLEEKTQGICPLYFFGQTDRQTDIVVHRVVTLPKRPS